MDTKRECEESIVVFSDFEPGFVVTAARQGIGRRLSALPFNWALLFQVDFCGLRLVFLMGCLLFSNNCLRVL